MMADSVWLFFRYFAWLEEKLQDGVTLDEVQAADKLEEMRSCVVTNPEVSA